MTDILQPSTTEAAYAWSFPVSGKRGTEIDGGCWETALADLLDQALTVDAFIDAARQTFGENCTVVPPGEGVSMQQVIPPERIVITGMVKDMVIEACCY